MSEGGGERGIRTLGTFARTTVFETATFNHSATSPQKIAVYCVASSNAIRHLLYALISAVQDNCLSFFMITA